jgi:hypothetical protein
MIPSSIFWVLICLMLSNGLYNVLALSLILWKIHREFSMKFCLVGSSSRLSCRPFGKIGKNSDEKY